MSIIRQTICVSLLLALTTTATGNWITSWGDGQQGQDFDISQVAGTITILDGGGNDYRFYAETSQGSGVEGVINNITVDTGATGDFTLLIDHPDAGEAGALHWKAGDLTYPAGTSTVLGIHLGGDLATEDDVYLEEVAGDIYVAGKLHEDGQPQELTYDLVVDGDIDGNIFIEELHGEILVPNGTVSGDITTGTVPFTPRTGGGVDIGGSYSATITIDDGFDGRIAIGGGLVNGGRIDVMGPNLGQIDLGGDLVAPAQIFSH